MMHLLHSLKYTSLLLLCLIFINHVVAQTEISSLAEITSTTGNYTLTADIDASSFSGFTGTVSNFRGTLDGGYHTISGLRVPLFTSVNGGTVKNLRLDNVQVTGTNNVGAIAATATGGARIYNCGILSRQGTSTVSISGTGNVGGLVGSIDGETRVVNCYSYANVSGGTYAAGIVGYSDEVKLAIPCTTADGWTANNTSGAFHLNTWSTEADASNMKTPFMEYWRNNAEGSLANAQIRYSTITGLPAGTYTVSCSYRLFNEANNNIPSAGVYFYTQGSGSAAQTTNLTNIGTTSTYVGKGVRYGTVSVDVTVNNSGTLNLGFNITGATRCNWLAFKFVKVEQKRSSRIANCMMYGNVTSATNISPVYGCLHASNLRDYPLYNFYRSQAVLPYTAYNNQLAIDKDEYLTRFPFYRHIQNTHRQMATYFIFDDRTEAHTAEVGHWVVLPDVAPYPIVEAWPTGTHRTTQEIAANLPPTTTEPYHGRLLTDMGNDGYLTVNMRIGSSNFTSQLPITDMDTDRYDFTWGKVVLPFVNEYSGWTRNYAQICTGWRITAITGGTTGALTNYNFADRHCTAKDLFNATTNPYIFAQGGNYIVPYGVTAITIEANFATAYYLSDPSYETGYDANYDNALQLGGAVPTTYHGRTVYTNLATLVDAMSTSTNPHTQAIVLVGNYHYNQQALGGTLLNTDKACSIMSVDEDNNQEPDYGWYSYHNIDRTAIPPMRFDFVPNIGIGMAARVTGSQAYPTIGIWHTRGWFELTETSLSFMSECEINSYNFTNNDNGHGNNRWIANSGYFSQIVRAKSGACSKLSYIQFGGNVYVEQLHPGSHTDDGRVTTLVPVVVTGGEIEECFMTGVNTNGTATGNNIRFFCAGGRLHKYLSAYVERPTTTGVNVEARVDHALIRRFFGGGTSAVAPITGNIDVTIDNSLVDFYCGGPEFGNMSAGKTVSTTANGTIFKQYYGAGFGGTSLTTRRDAQSNPNFNAAQLTYPLGFNYYTDKRLQVDPTLGVAVSYAFEFFLYSGGSGSGVARFYNDYAKFSLAQTGNVTNTLTGCTVIENYYGGGCQGRVNGTISSNLTNCTLMRNAFGGGYRATATTIDVYPTTQPTYSVYTRETGLFSDFGIITPEQYTWQTGAADAVDNTNHIIYTTEDLSTLGNVTGNITLTLKDCTVGESVYGGGNESPSLSNTNVNVEGRSQVEGSVYGGGNRASVGSGSSNKITVNIRGRSHVRGNVYGGGNRGTINGSTSVNVGNRSE